MFQRLSTATLLLLLFCALLASGCSFLREPPVPTIIVVPPDFPTSTLDSGIISMTPKYTATLEPTITPTPSETPIPTNTELPFTNTPIPSITPTSETRGSINFTSQVVNMRSGPGQSFTTVDQVRAGTLVIVFGTNDKKDWYYVQLEDRSREGWIAASLLTMSNAESVQALKPEFFTQRTQVALLPTPTGGTADTGTSARTATPRKSTLRTPTDVLADCDKPNGEAHKTFTGGTSVTIWWSWFAKTPEQLQDHINYAEYTVAVDGKPLSDYKNFQSNVARQGDGNYWIYWFVPIGKPSAGEHKISYKVTWRQKISDGYQTFGPGGAKEAETGTCAFTVK